MTATALNPYRPGNSLLHQLDARVKVGLTLGFILATALTPPGAWPVLMLLLALALAAVILAELRASFVLARTALALPFALAALPLLFTVTGTPLFSLPWGWTVTWEGLLRVANVAIKMWLSVLMAFMLTATTPFTAILVALRGWGLSKLLVAILALMWRYLFVLVEEAQRLMRARAARSGRVMQGRGGSLAWRARVTGGMAGNLLLRGADRAERIYGAMAARGYNGEPRVLAQPPLTAGNRAVLALGCISLALLALTGILFWG
jgi:cobalt/nickel transport system permease protein